MTLPTRSQTEPHHTIRTPHVPQHRTGAPEGTPVRGTMMQQNDLRDTRGWAWEELNLRPHAYQACALTT
jgi:hypothetical protein